MIKRSRTAVRAKVADHVYGRLKSVFDGHALKGPVAEAIHYAIADAVMTAIEVLLSEMESVDDDSEEQLLGE